MPQATLVLLQRLHVPGVGLCAAWRVNPADGTETHVRVDIPLHLPESTEIQITCKPTCLLRAAEPSWLVDIASVGAACARDTITNLSPATRAALRAQNALNDALRLALTPA